jgi:hypothetical protein
MVQTDLTRSTFEFEIDSSKAILGVGGPGKLLLHPCIRNSLPVYPSLPIYDIQKNQHSRAQLVICLLHRMRRNTAK